MRSSAKASRPAASPRFPRARAFLRRVGMALSVLLAALVAVIGWFFHDLDGKVRAALVAEGRELEAVIGRRVSIGAVHVALGGVTEIVVRDVAVEAPAGATGELAIPALRVAEARLAVALGKLIRSRGRAIEVTRFAIDGPEVNIVRTPSGLSIDDVRTHAAKAPKRPPGKQRVALQSVAITGAKIRLHELGADAAGDVTVEQITLTGHDLGADAPSHLSLGAAVLATTKNLAVELDLAPTAAGTMALTRADLRLNAVRLAPVLRWARAKESVAIDLAEAEIDAAVSIEPGASIGVKGRVALGKVRIAGGGPAAIGLVADATIEPENGAITARSLELAASGATVRGSLGVHGLPSAPAFDAIDLEAAIDADAIGALLPAKRGLEVRGPIAAKVQAAGNAEEARAEVKIDVADVSVHGKVDLRGIGRALTIESLAIDARGPIETLLDLVPPARRPPGVAVRGPFRVDVAARGAIDDLSGKIAVDLDHVAVHARGLAKPAGVPLGVAVEGRAAGGRVEITQGELRFGSIAMAARGWARGADELEIAFEPRGGRGADIASLLRLVPAANARGAIDGRVAVSGKVRRSPVKTTIEVATKLREARVRQALVAIDGGLDASARVEVSAGKSAAQIEVDLGAARIEVAPVLTKRAGQPVRVAFSVTREGERVHVSDARATAPGLTIEGLTVERDPTQLRVGVARSTIAIAPLVEMVPLLRGRLPPLLSDLTMRFGMEVEATGSDFAAGSARLTSFDLSGGIGHVTGAVTIDGLRSPRAVRVDVRGGDLDLSGIARKDGGADALVPDTGVKIEAKVHLDSVKVGGETARGIDADVDLVNGRVDVRSLRAAALGGTIELWRSYVDLSDVPEIEVHAKAQGIDLSHFSSERVEELRGRASGEIDLRGRGLDAAQIARTLRGTARLELDDVRGRARFDHHVKLANPTLAKLQKRRENKPRTDRHALALREVRATLDVDAGKVRAKAPIVVRSDDFVAQLTGTIGSGPDLALDGHIEIAPHVIAEATKRALVPVRPIPLELRLFEDAEGRKVELRDLRETLGALRGALRNAVDNAAIDVP